jgi:sodium/potassium-transporting ATPase subunit alpha
MSQSGVSGKETESTTNDHDEGYVGMISVVPDNQGARTAVLSEAVYAAQPGCVPVCGGNEDSGPDDSENTETSGPQWHKLTTQQVLDALDTSMQGLSSEEVLRRAQLHGRNELSPPPQTPWALKALGTLVGGFQSMLWCGAALCLVVFGLSRGSEVQPLALSVALVVVVLVTSALQLYQEGASDRLMAALRAMKPSFALVYRDGGRLGPVPSAELVPGDVVRLCGGDLIAADMRVVLSEDLAVNNSSLTGENIEVKLTPEPSAAGVSMYEARNLARSGCSVSRGAGVAVVFAIGDHTFFGRIATSTTTTARPETLMKHEVRRLVSFMAVVATTLGAAFFVLALFHGYTWLEAVIFCIGIIVANVPEGLLPQMTVALTLIAQRMLRLGVLVTNLEVVETLGATTVICSDKTGTLTCNRMTVVHLVYDWAVSAT